MEETSNDKLDAIIFGVNGFLGKFLLEEAIEILTDLQFGIAGTNESELKKVLETVGKQLVQDLQHIPIILADVDDSKSLEAMAKKCKLLFNCYGPFHKYGESVIKACIQAGTHYVDITGEPQYNNNDLWELNEMAEKSGSYIIAPCGYESMPAEMGVLYAMKCYPGLLNTVEFYWETNLNYKHPTRKAILPNSVWNSLLNYMHYTKDMMRMQKKLNYEKEMKVEPKLKLNNGVQKVGGSYDYFIAFPTAAISLVQRSQSLFFQDDQDLRPVQFATYIGFKSYKLALLLPLWMAICFILSKFRATRQLLLKYPHIFTDGYITHQEPAEAHKNAIQFIYVVKAKGWYKSSPHEPDPVTELHIQITTVDNTYAVTSKAMLLCGKVMLQQKDKMPVKGGVYPPGYAMAKTEYLEELCSGNYGLEFDII